LCGTSIPRQSELTITVNQLQEGEPFLDALPIELTIDNKKVPLVITPKSKTATMTVPLERQAHRNRF
jgi:hypothetical protein